MIKLNENFGKPILTFYLKDNLRKDDDQNADSEKMISKLIQDSIFKKHVKDFEIKNAKDDQSSLQT